MNVEYRGNTYNVNDQALDNIDVFEEIIKVQSGDPFPMIHVIKTCIGEEGYTLLKDSLRDENGHAKTSDVMQGFSDIMAAAGEDKKK